MLSDTEDFDPVKIFERASASAGTQTTEVFTQALPTAGFVRSVGRGNIYISGSLKDFEEVWYDYFDLGRDYAALERR